MPIDELRSLAAARGIEARDRAGIIAGLTAPKGVRQIHTPAGTPSEDGHDIAALTDSADLDKLPCEELLAIAKEKGIGIPGRPNRDKIIEELRKLALT